MHIDELLRAYSAFNSNTARRRRDQFFNKKRSIFDRMNQSIAVRDLVVRTVKGATFGESDFKEGQTKPHEKERLISHISTLMRLLNEDHRARNCESIEPGVYQTKNDKKNNITRLSTPEFSLYTQKPMTILEFHDLYAEITALAESLEPNTHLLLSTFAVVGEDKKLLNMSIYIQGGRPPQCYCFAKNTVSNVDVMYEKGQLAFSQTEDGEKSQKFENITGASGININTGSVFEITTEGGATYTQAIDVCIDHRGGHARKQLVRKLKSESYDTDFIPAQIEQCVTSNTIMLIKENCISTRMLHVDPNMSMVDHYRKRVGEHVINPQGLARISEGISIKMQVGPKVSGYYVEDPPFGALYTVEILAERPLGKFTPDILPAVKAHNEHVIKKGTFAASLSLKDDASLKLIDIHLHRDDVIEIIISTLKQLEERLLTKCEPTFFEDCFKTEEFHQKKAAQGIIQTHFKRLYENITPSKETFLFLIKPWFKDLNVRLAHVPLTDTPSPLITLLKIALKEGIEIELSEALDIHFSEEFDEGSRPERK